MFITEEDYRVVIGENALKVVSQASQEIRDNAELEACEEIAGYLRPKYDTEAVFSAEGENRNRLVVMYAADAVMTEENEKALIDASCLQNFVQVRGAGAVVTRS